MKRLALLSATLLALSAGSASGVNDRLVPADDSAPAHAEAVGHPAAANNQTPATAANPPFSRNNPGVSTGARGQERSQATEHCPG